jgi:hypothetical protein
VQRSVPLSVQKKKESKKKKVTKKGKEKNKRTGDRFGSNAGQDRLGHGAPVRPRVHPSFLFFPLPFLLFHSFLFLALVISNV